MSKPSKDCARIAEDCPGWEARYHSFERRFSAKAPNYAETGVTVGGENADELVSRIRKLESHMMTFQPVQVGTVLEAETYTEVRVH
jgi:hypothetical protein